MRSRIQGVPLRMKSFGFIFGLLLGELLLSQSDNLSKTLQSPHMSAAEGQKIAEMTIHKLESIRSKENLLLFWSKVTNTATCNDLDVGDPILSWQWKRPQRYEKSTQEGHFPGSVEDFYQPIYFEALDLAINGIQKRYEQPGYDVYFKLESLLVKAVNSEGYEEGLKFIVDLYKEDFNPGQLNLQLHILSYNLPPISSPYNLASILQLPKEN